jgi:hypothetical protein
MRATGRFSPSATMMGLMNSSVTPASYDRRTACHRVGGLSPAPFTIAS